MKKAVVLFNLGGPDKLENVKPFLFNLFYDPAIINLPKIFRYPIAKLISKKREPVAKKIYEVDNPRIAILSVKSEEGKGNNLVKDTSKLLSNTDLNFTGNIEPNEIPFSKADVILLVDAARIHNAAEAGLFQPINFSKLLASFIYSKVKSYFY